MTRIALFIALIVGLACPQLAIAQRDVLRARALGERPAPNMDRLTEYYADELLAYAATPQEERGKYPIQPVWDRDPRNLGQRNSRGELISFTPEVCACLEIRNHPVSKDKPKLVKLYRAVVLKEADIPSDIKELFGKDDLTPADIDNFIKFLPGDKKGSVVDAAFEVYKTMWLIYDILYDYSRTRPGGIKIDDTFQKIIPAVEYVIIYPYPERYNEWMIIGQLAKANICIKAGYCETAASTNLSPLMTQRTADEKEKEKRRGRIAAALADLRLSEEGSNMTLKGFTVAESCDRCAKLLSEYGILGEFKRLLSLKWHSLAAPASFEPHTQATATATFTSI